MQIAIHISSEMQYTNSRQTDCHPLRKRDYMAGQEEKRTLFVTTNEKQTKDVRGKPMI